MKRSTKWIIGGTFVAVMIGGAGTAVAVAGGGKGEGPDQPITGDALAKASAAALEHTGGGTITETEVGDEESRYEVEVSRPDGSRVDVQLDANFTVVGTQTETGPDDSDGSGR